jgi:hypothetical protein
VAGGWTRWTLGEFRLSTGTTPACDARLAQPRSSEGIKSDVRTSDVGRWTHGPIPSPCHSRWHMSPRQSEDQWEARASSLEPAFHIRTSQYGQLDPASWNRADGDTLASRKDGASGGWISAGDGSEMSWTWWTWWTWDEGLAQDAHIF